MNKDALSSNREISIDNEEAEDNTHLKNNDGKSNEEKEDDHNCNDGVKNVWKALPLREMKKKGLTK